MFVLWEQTGEASACCFTVTVYILCTLNICKDMHTKATCLACHENTQNIGFVVLDHRVVGLDGPV